MKKYYKIAFYLNFKLEKIIRKNIKKFSKKLFTFFTFYVII